MSASGDHAEVAMNERRDLQGLAVKTQAGFEAVAPKGGLPRGDGRNLDVPVLYRGHPMVVVVVPQEAEPEEVEAAMLLRCEALDVQEAEKQAETQAALDAEFKDLQKAFTDLEAGTTTETAVKELLGGKLGLNVAAASEEVAEEGVIADAD
jgi:hypothetical protein